MPDAQDHHAVGIDAVTDDVRVGNRAFAELCAGNLSAAIGKGGEAVRGLNDPVGHVARGRGIEISDVAADSRSASAEKVHTTGVTEALERGKAIRQASPTTGAT
jgi:hypothetical protein